MAKLPKKIATPEDAKETTLREFISTAAHRPATATTVTRVNMSLTEDDLAGAEALQKKLSLSRVEIFRAGLLALERVPDEKLQSIAEEIRRNSPKAGRPPVNK